MKKYLVKFQCNGKIPGIGYRTVEADNPAEAIASVNNYHREIGAWDRRAITAVYEQVWNIDPNKM